MDRLRLPMTAIVLLLAGLSVGSLLGELYGVLPMSISTPAITLPALVVLMLIGFRGRNSELGRRIAIGAIGGLAGTIGYDLVRIPFSLAGQRIFAPIFSYGLLIDGGGMSSNWTDTLGWLFHLSNGITFGIAYAVVAARRHWGWAVMWGVLLETAAFASVFTEVYGLTGKTWAIATAYAAHVAYGWPLGLIVQRMEAVRARLELRVPATVGTTLAIVLIVLWQAPWVVPSAAADARAAARASGTPTAVVLHDRFTPEWLRIEPGECIELISRSDITFDEPTGALPAGGSATWCFDEAGVQRVTLGSEPYSGGFVYVWER